MNYNTLSDNEIIKLIRSQDADAMEYMLKKYGNLVKREIRTVYLIGAEMEDLTQEGMIGLFKAIRDYEPDKGASFSTFATLCIRRQVQTAIRTSNRKKHTPLNTYISIYAENEECGTALADDLEAEQNVSNPENMVIAREQRSVLEKKIHSELSSLENKVLELYLDGLSYTDIAMKLGKTEKAVDNALQRIRFKLSR
ncbi:MAG: RNA polymerase sporulation sigma factor SigH [Wujia sp.]